MPLCKSVLIVKMLGKNRQNAESRQLQHQLLWNSHILLAPNMLICIYILTEQ